MKQAIGFTLSILLTVLLLSILSGPVLGQGAGQDTGKLDGKAIFLAQKCSLCHSVSTAGIARTVKSEKMAGPDLVNIKMDAAAVTKFLHKETELNGKKHSKEVKLPDADTKALVDWILAQKK